MIAGATVAGSVGRMLRRVASRAARCSTAAAELSGTPGRCSVNRVLSRALPKGHDAVAVREDSASAVMEACACYKAERAVTFNFRCSSNSPLGLLMSMRMNSGAASTFLAL